jgi:hypothetical protein
MTHVPGKMPVNIRKMMMPDEKAQTHLNPFHKWNMTGQARTNLVAKMMAAPKCMAAISVRNMGKLPGWTWRGDG